MASGWTCGRCAKTNPTKARFCAGCGAEHVGVVVQSRTRLEPRSPDRASYLDPREHDAYCRIHKIALDPTGYCARAEAWWVPKFRCPHCAGPLWDNGYCATCTPKTQTFSGDYFEPRWDPDSDREWGHFVRVSQGPSPSPTDEQVVSYLAALKAMVPHVGREIGQVPMRQPGEESEIETEVPF